MVRSSRLTEADSQCEPGCERIDLMDSLASDNASITELAAANGLSILPETIKINELGLDFRVAIAETTDGQRWVLRIPRRPDVLPRATVEGQLLKRVAPYLGVAVPDWRIQSADLIAYPLLPGEPGLTISNDGTPTWHFNEESPTFANSLGEFLAQLHAISPDEVSGTGIDQLTPGEFRESIRNDITRVKSAFEVSSDLLDRWTSWLADDRYWPEWSTLTHGEIYPAHLLLTGEKIVGVLDWTTAAVSNPAKDFVFHRASVSRQAFDATVKRYVEHGGRVWPKFADQCTELFSIAPVTYGIYALTTGDPTHVKAAAAQLNP